MNESESHSKLLRAGNQDKEDRISSLPDGILCNILSFLPFKYAVATCILSSRWKCVWTSLPNLCFDQARIMTDDSWNSFEKSVNMALLLSDSAINSSSTAVEVAKSGWQFRHFNLTTMPKLEAFVLRMNFSISSGLNRIVRPNVC